MEITECDAQKCHHRKITTTHIILTDQVKLVLLI